MPREKRELGKYTLHCSDEAPGVVSTVVANGDGEVVSTAVPSDRPPVSQQVLDAPLVTDDVVERAGTDVLVATVIEDERTWPVRWITGFMSACEWIFGFFSLVVGLAVLASVPILQLLSLGYLLEVSGRVARTGRLTAGLIGIRKAARIGSLVFGTWLMLLPLQLISDYWYSSYLIDPQSEITRNWRMALLILTAMMLLHIIAAWYCGGKLRHFFWPLLAPFSLLLWVCRLTLAQLATSAFRQSSAGRVVRDLLQVRPLREWFVPAMLLYGLWRGGMWSRCRDGVWEFVSSLRLPYYFWLGLRGFVGAMAWLLLPVVLFIASTSLPPPAGVLLGLIGALLLFLVALYLPFLQAHFAAENHLRAVFQLGRVRADFRRAPVAFWMALLVTLLFALPLYVLMIEATPREVVFLPSLFFVAFILPARLLTGWAVGRARRRDRPGHFLLRWAARFASLPVAGFYVLVVFFTRYTSWHGVWSLFEQHAFLIPAPFLNV
jgi:hypothetical protein